jgi:RHS repeat-associated protein
VRAITDASGAVVAHYELDAWGAQLASSSPFSGGFAFGYVGSLGVRTDATTGLIWMRHRWFDPNGLQRFISRDPLDKTYFYAHCNPVSHADPLGLQPPDSVMDKRIGINLPSEAYPKVSPDGVVVAASILFEPVDWAVTAYDAWNEGPNWTMALGLLPLVSGPALRRIGKLFDFNVDLSNIKLRPEDMECPSRRDIPHYAWREGRPNNARTFDPMGRPADRGELSIWSDMYNPIDPSATSRARWPTLDPRLQQPIWERGDDANLIDLWKLPEENIGRYSDFPGHMWIEGPSSQTIRNAVVGNPLRIK